jgi:adenylate cyclase
LKYYEQLFRETDSLNASLAKESTSKFNLQLEAQKNREKITVLLKDRQIQEQKVTRQRIILFALIGGLALIIALAVSIFRGKKRSDELLLNILPSEVAEELKAKGSAAAKQFDDVTVMFTDFKNFTQISEKLSPTELVNEIHTCFKAFDNIITKHNIEKIKTIGDAYMCAGGLPVANTTNATDVVNAALEIQKFMQEHLQQRKSEGKEPFEIRIGIHTGPVVAGIVGVKKFAYDIWGDTVNIASRMESSGEGGKVNISGSTYELVKDKFKCKHRGKIQAKNKGEIDMYFVE